MDNNIKEIVAHSTSSLSSILDLSGHFLYSSSNTLRQGKIYLMGHNPGGSPSGREDESIRRSIEELHQKTSNEYIDDSWMGRPAGASPLQKRVCWLLENMDFDVRKVCASNLIFARSVDAASSNFNELADICWPVHKKILEIVKPKLIIAFGNSGDCPYEYLKDKLGYSIENTHESGHGNWQCKAVKSDEEITIVGLPHLSRYAVDRHPHVIDWIKTVSN